MDERWMRDSITALRGAIEKLNRGNEGDFKQALIIADHATEIIMRNYLIFKRNIDPPYDYLSLLKQVKDRVSISSELSEIIETFRLLRDGFEHNNIKKIEKGLKGTTTGLTLERSSLEEYLTAIRKLFEILTGGQIDVEGG
ncbi:hypothetical protein ES707_13495 [subsurface metagenome]